MAETAELFVCGTPIGNLGDVSARLVEVLGSVDLVYAEDTRRTAKLMSHLGLQTPLRSLFTGNEMERSSELVEHLQSGQRIALVSDAGMPSISDPGATAVEMARDGGFRVTAVPGPSAVTMALALSGYPADRFVFEGFLPRKGAEREARIRQIAREPRPVVFFASPHRLVEDLTEIARIGGANRSATINRELTKLHEEVWRGDIAGALDHWSGSDLRGEITVVLGPIEAEAVDFDVAVSEALSLIESGETVSSAARSMADLTGLSRREIYQALLAAQDRS